MPFVSKAQQRWGNSPAGRAALGAKGVAEWNSATKGKKLPQRKAEGGEVNEWDALPRTPDGRPNIVVTKPPAQSMADAASGFGQRIHDWFSQPSPIKLDSPPPQDFREPSQAIGEGMRGLGSGYLQSLKDLTNPFTKDENDKYVADQPLPPPTEKAPQVQKDPISLGAPVAAEVASTFAGKPGTGLGWGLLKSAGIGMAGAAAKKAIPKAATQIWDHGFLDTSKFKTVSTSKGTMAGGFKVDPTTGQEWYVKQAPNLEQAKNEKLTAELYKLFGVPVADVHLTNVNGKPGIASKKIEGVQLGDYTSGNVSDIPGLHENYPIHALLANHDAVGTGPENPLGNIIVDAAGKAHVIDTGGGLLYKGTGTKKAKFTPEVVEIDTMADPNYSHLSAEVFGGVDPNVARVGAQRIADVDEKQIAKLVEMYGPADKMEKLNLLSTLLKRKHNIQEMYGVQPKKASTQQVLAQALGTNEPKPAPAHDPYEQIPFTEDDYAKWADEIPPEVVPDDAWKAPRPAEEKGVDLTTLPFAKALGDSVYISDLTNSVLPKPALQNIAKNLTSGPYDIDHWNGAVNLWQVAEHINPQLAEALFRNLPVSAQPKVGYAIKALKDELGYSPWNSVAKGSGKDGKFPLDYDYYSTKTNSFPVPDNLLKDKAYQGNVKKYSALLEKGPELPEQVATKEEYSGIPAGYANPWLNAPKEYTKLMGHFKTGPEATDVDVKGIGKALAAMAQDYPAYADHVYKQFPSYLQPGIATSYGQEKKAIDKTQKALEAKKAESGDFDFMEGRIAAQTHKDSPLGIAFASKFLEPIEDFQNWTPSGGHTPPAFKSAIQKFRAKKSGANVNFEIYKGGEIYGSQVDDLGMKYPMQIEDPSMKWTEPGWFAAKEKGDINFAAAAYGPVEGSYILRSQKAFTLDWEAYNGSPKWSNYPTHNAIVAARNKGADLIILKGVLDPQSGLHDQYIILNPAILRGPNAKFDPTHLHKAWPLAGIAGVVGGSTYTYGPEGNSKMNRGGVPALVYRAKALARGGPGSAPWAVRNSSHPRHKAGMIKSSIPGRTDKIPMSVPPGSYILPADVPSALGEGNTMAGEKILGTMFKSGPYSPGSTQAFSGKQAKSRRRFAEGGPAEQTENDDIPIIAAGGEYVIHPEQVAELGNGDMKAGHRILDKFVLSVRKKHIETLKKLKPPKK